MDSPQFNVMVDGTVLDGFDADTVLLQLQQKLKLPEGKAQLLIANKSVTVKRDIDATVANAYCSRLRSLGVNASVEPTISPAAKPTPTRQSTQRYFSDAPIAASETAYTTAFKRAVLRGNAALSRVVLGYGLLALLGSGLFLYYLLSHAYLLLAPPILFSATVYFLVSITLAVIAALLLRPVLAQTRDTDYAMPLSPIQEPALFAFVTQLCDKLELKSPEEIVLTTSSANTATLLPGFKNLKHGAYRLSLSLPALENGSLNHAAGLLAADLATQTYLPMLRYRALTNLIHRQLDACVTNHDWLARRIEALAQSAPSKLTRIFNLIEKIFEKANQYLQKISAHMQKIDIKLQRSLVDEQDRYSALVAGSDQFIDMMIFRAHLEAAAHDANEKNTEDRIEGGLVDDLPALIRHYYENMDENFTRTIQRQWNSETTPRRDEPSIMRERIEHVASTAKPGLIDDQEAALSLLRQHGELARAATLCTYRQAALHMNADELMPTDELTYTATQDILQRQQAAIYFNDWFKPFRFWSLADYKLISDMPLQDAAMQLSVCVNEIRRLSPDRSKLLAEYDRLHNQLREILLAQHVLAAGKKFSFRYINYDGTTLVPVLEDRQKEISAVMEKLLQQETVMGGRITLGLRLSGQDERDVTELHDALRMLHDIGTRLNKLSLDCTQLEQLLQRQHQLREANYSLPIKKLETKIDDACTLLMVRLNDIPYPLDTRYRSLKSFVEAVLTPQPGKQHSAILQRGQRFIEVLYRVNEKLSRQAADYGTIAEEAYRIEPIRLISRE